MVCLVSVLACGGSTAPPPQPVGLPAAMVATAAGSADVVVAQVAGRPVWGSCVAAQVGRGVNRDVALRDCIDFELLAQVAEARGFGLDREVADETKRALVSRLVETDFERRYRTPADLAAQLDRAFAEDDTQTRMNRPELRESFYVRVVIPELAPPAADAVARAVADKIHAALADETGLFPNHVTDVAYKVANDSAVTLELKAYPIAYRGGGTVAAYEQALFAIPEVGQVSPVFRTKWGWDVVLLTKLIEAKQFTRDEVEPIKFASLRREEFDKWVDSIRLSLGVTVLTNKALLEAEPGARPGRKR